MKRKTLLEVLREQKVPFKYTREDVKVIETTCKILNIDYESFDFTRFKKIEDVHKYFVTFIGKQSKTNSHNMYSLYKSFNNKYDFDLIEVWRKLCSKITKS